MQTHDRSLQFHEFLGRIRSPFRIQKLLDLRAALTALKGPLGNEKAFRNKIQQILGDPSQRNKLINELGLSKEGE